ncbi:methyltransferase family protein [Jatrophihabitans fulvus]
MTSGPPTSPAPVWDVVNGLAGYWALSAAVELGVFDALDRAPADAATLAGSLGVQDAEDLTLLAQLLAAKGFLDTDGERWELTPVARRFLVSSSPASMATLVHRSPGPHHAWPALAATLRTGVPEGTVRDDLEAMYPDLVSATAATQSAVAAGVARELRERGLWDGTGTVVDLGCGSGAWLEALTASARGVGVDLPHVLHIARPRLRGRDVTLVGGDYLSVALPVDTADVVVLAHVLRAEDTRRARALVDRALGLLRPGGVLLVADYFRPDDGGTGDEYRAAGHELTLALTMRASTRGRGVTEAALDGWCAAHGARTATVVEPVPRQRVHVLVRESETGGTA